MNDDELQAEGLTVLPQRLETTFCGNFGGGFFGHGFRGHGVFFRGGPVHQTSNISQSNFNNQIGGDCIGGFCGQSNFQSNFANVHQNAFQRFR